jgi:hypothetical protein
VVGFAGIVTVRDAKAVARQWVIEEGSNLPGFVGAFFHGSVNWLPDDASMPATSDVDVMVVLGDSTPLQKPGKLRYQGILLEISSLPAEHVRSAKQVLGVSHLAPVCRRQRLCQTSMGDAALRARAGEDPERLQTG